MATRKKPHYPGFYTILEAAEHLCVSERTVRNMIQRGQLRRVGPFRPYRLAAREVEGFTPPA